MIPKQEILSIAAVTNVLPSTVEKDYVLSWTLHAISKNQNLSTWVFNGGTCLRKCWFETYRFSEDLDFTVSGDRDLDPVQLSTVFTEIGQWLHDRAGLELQIEERSFRKRKNRRGHPTIQARIGFVGPLRTPTSPKV